MQEIGWFRDLEREWYDMWRDDRRGELWDVELMARAIVVSAPGEDALLLDPARVDAAARDRAGDVRRCRGDAAGFSAVELFGGTGGTTFAFGSPRLLLVAALSFFSRLAVDNRE